LSAGVAAAEHRWLEGAERHGAGHWLDNVCARVEPVCLGEHRVPLVMPTPAPGTSYVASPVSAWARYPHEELRRHGRAAHALTHPLVAALGLWMRAGGLDHGATLGNWLVSTNLHPGLSRTEWRRAREAALELVPDHPLLIRNVCPAIDPTLASHLHADGWWLTPARHIYLCDPAEPDVARRNNVKNDRRALNKAHFDRVSADAMTREELPALRHLFRQLFIDKHSALNPDFTPAFFECCLRDGFLHLEGLRLEGRLVGVVGTLSRHGWLTAPLLGYDTGAPQSLGIYRALMAMSFEQAARGNLRLHLSSGAGAFKRARGGKPHLEFTALYAHHLPPAVRAAARGFHVLMCRLAPPLLRRYG